MSVTSSSHCISLGEFLNVVMIERRHAVVGCAMRHSMDQALIYATLEMAFEHWQPKAEVLLLRV